MSRTLARCAAAMTVRIGDTRVGRGRPLRVIAEAGVNHDGSVERALGMVDAAADAGADYVKFQVFRAQSLVVAAASAAAYQRGAGYDDQHAMLRRLELDDRDFLRIADRCRRRGVRFLATPFDGADVPRLVALGAPAIKLASTDLNNAPLQRAAIATGLPLIVSTGAATAREIFAAVARLRAGGAGRRLVLLHCVSGYPTPIDAANVAAIRRLARRCRAPVGFSDHTTSVQIGGWAAAAGACVLEKHFTLDRSAPGPDHAMSLEPHELRDYIRFAREAHAALGAGRLGMQPLEADVRASARRSVVAARPLKRGETLDADALALKRPSGGIPPDEFDALLGRRLLCDVAADAALSWEMVR